MTLSFGLLKFVLSSGGYVLQKSLYNYVLYMIILTSGGGAYPNQISIPYLILAPRLYLIW